MVQVDPLRGSLAPWLYLRGAPANPPPDAFSMQQLRAPHWKETAWHTLGISDLEDHRRQVRSTVKAFFLFRKQLPPQDRKTLPLPLQAVMFCHWLLPQRPKVECTSTIWGWMRQLQSAFPQHPLCTSAPARKLRKGLGKHLPLRPQDREVATTRQYCAFLKACPDAWTHIAVVIMGRGAGRLADVRVWARGQGCLTANMKTRTLLLTLAYRKCDQAGESTLRHTVGPFDVPTNLEWRRCQEVLAQIKKGNTHPVPSPYPTVPSFVAAIREAREHSNLKTVISLRRMRAKHGGGSVQETADLLGHKEGSKYTLGYMGDIPEEKKAQRRLLSRRGTAIPD